MKLFIIFVLFIIFAVPVSIVCLIAALVKSDRQKNGYYLNGQYIPPAPLPPKPPREKLSASVIMLLIGTAFIVLAAITFVAANWVDMQPAGRVSALLAESALAFGISVLMKKVIRLNRTSMSFYMIGTIVAVVSLITAGYYDFLGEWFAVNGGGAPLLYGVSAVAAASASFLAKAIYKSKSFDYIGASFVSLAVVFFCIQPTETVEQFAPIIAMAQLIVTAVIHLLKPQKDTEMERPVVIVGDISAVVYQMIAGLYVFSTTFTPTAYTFAVLTILLVQLLVYGIFKNQKWMFIFFNLIGLYTGIITAFLAEDEIGTSMSMLLFAGITAVFYAVNRIIPKNMLSCHIITLIGIIIGSIVSFTADCGWLSLIVPAAASLGIVSYTLDKDKSVQTASGLFSPVMPFFMAVYLNSQLDSTDETRTLVFGLLTAVYTAVSALFVFVPKIKAKCISQVCVYANMVCAVGVLLNISGYSQLFMIPAALCIAHFAVSYFMSGNITAVGSVASLILLTNSVIRHYISYDEPRMYIMFALFAVLIVISRIVFPDGFTAVKGNRKHIDVILLSSWIAVLPFPVFNRTSFFLRTIALAVFLAGFIKRSTSRDNACVILSFSSAIACFAFLTRPFLLPDSSIIASKVNIAIFLMLGIAYRFIWRNHPNGSKVSSTVIFIISFASLIIDGIAFDSVANRIFVLAVTAGVLVFSFFVKSKTWFIASSLALVIMTVFSTIRYFNSAGWWLYLLIVGIIFIVIASINEVCRKNGETMKSTVAKKFSDWTW